MKCPCKDCLTLPACKSQDMYELVQKCSLVSQYLSISKMQIEQVKANTIKKRLFSKLRPIKHKNRLKILRKYIDHKFTIDY